MVFNVEVTWRSDRLSLISTIINGGRWLVEGAVTTVSIVSMKYFNQVALFYFVHRTHSPPSSSAEERCFAATSDLKEPWAFQRFSSLHGAIHYNTASEGWRDTLWHNYSDSGRKRRGLYQRMRQKFAVLSIWLIYKTTEKMTSTEKQ